MAITTQLHPAAARFAGLPDAGDRVKEFKKAKRHSVNVRLMRFLLPVIAACIGGLYFVPTRIAVEIDGGEASVESVDLSQGGLKMVNPRIKGVHEKHGIYDIRAENATQQVENTDLIRLNVITADLVSQKGEKTSFVAPSGLFHSKKEELIFDNGVTIGGNAGFSGKLKTATAFFKSNTLISTDPVELGFFDSSIKARSMTFYSSEGRAIFEGGVSVHLERKLGGNKE